MAQGIAPIRGNDAEIRYYELADPEPKMGVGAIDYIESKQGSVYIRGGISGKNRTTIICEGDFYTKLAAECEIQCSGVVNVDYYLLNCKIKAKEVVLEAKNSMIIGGSIEVEEDYKMYRYTGLIHAIEFFSAF